MVLGFMVVCIKWLFLLFLCLVVGWGGCWASIFSFVLSWDGFLWVSGVRWFLGWHQVHVHGWFLVCSDVFWCGRFVYSRPVGCCERESLNLPAYSVGKNPPWSWYGFKCLR
jgi:hypothetical protein